MEYYTSDYLPASWWPLYNTGVPAKVPSPSQPPLSFASGSFAGTLYGYIFVRAGILVNHEAKLKGGCEGE